MRLRAWVAVAAAVVGVLVPAAAGQAEAAFGAGTASTAVLGSDVLDPPTAFTAVRTCVAAAAPTVVGSTSALLLPGGGTRVTVAKLAGTAAGDVVVAYVAADQNLPGGEPNRTPVPVGETWATSEAFSGDWLASRLVVRRATSTEPAAYSFDVPDNWHATTAVLTVYRGVGTSAGWVSSANLMTYQAVSTPALTQDVAPSRLVVMAAAAYSIGAITPPASAAHTIGLSHTAEIPAVLMADEVLTSAGSTGTRSMWLPKNTLGSTAALVLRGTPSSSRIDLAWTPSADATDPGYTAIGAHYVGERSDTPGSYGVTADLTLASATDTSVPLTSAVSYRVWAVAGTWTSAQAVAAVSACP